MESTAQVTQLEVGGDFAERYRVMRCLKSGGMGSVYQVLDSKTDRLRALKVMLPDIAADEDMRSRFLQEASVVGRVCSDHLVEVVDAGIAGADGNTPFLVMELLRGQDLATLLEQRGQLDAATVLDALSQVALGLDKVHAEGVIHRDLKPENLFVTTRDDGSMCLKILDFGVAKVVNHLATLRTTRSLGTPLYMAPEQLTGEGTIGSAADLYSLAHVAFCLLVGKPYWVYEAESESSAYAFVNKVVGGAPEPASVRARRMSVELPAAFDRWFAKAAAKSVGRRFDTAVEQIAALREALNQPADTSELAARLPSVPLKRASRASWWALGAFALVTLVVLVRLTRDDPAEERSDAGPDAPQLLAAPQRAASPNGSEASLPEPAAPPVLATAPSTTGASAPSPPATGAASSDSAIGRAKAALAPPPRQAASSVPRPPAGVPSAPRYDPLDEL